MLTDARMVVFVVIIMFGPLCLSESDIIYEFRQFHEHQTVSAFFSALQTVLVSVFLHHDVLRCVYGSRLSLSTSDALYVVQLN